MDKATLSVAVNALLVNTHPRNSSIAYEQAVCQFNSLLERAKALYPSRADIQSMKTYSIPDTVNVSVFEDAASRLKSALEIGSTTSSGELLAQVELPPDASAGVASDFAELEGAVSAGLEKTVLLLAGSIAEALLIARHPDTSDRGPGLAQLVGQAHTQNLFGTDTIRTLESLIDYRDLIHPRAGIRNRTTPNPARVDAAILALKLLCQDLRSTSLRYS